MAHLTPSTSEPDRAARGPLFYIGTCSLIAALTLEATAVIGRSALPSSVHWS